MESLSLERLATISRLHNLLDAVLLGNDEDAKTAITFILDNAAKLKPEKSVNSHS